MVGLAKALQEEVREFGIHVHSLNPALIQSQKSASEPVDEGSDSEPGFGRDGSLPAQPAPSIKDRQYWYVGLLGPISVLQCNRVRFFSGPDHPSLTQLHLRARPLSNRWGALRVAVPRRAGNSLPKGV